MVNIRSDRSVWFSFVPTAEFCVGRGAMGVVYRGWCSNNPKYEVAIKVVNGQSAQNPDIRRRARYEASLAIDHPNIIRMLGYCEDHPGEGDIYIVSDFVRGVTINQFAERLSPDRRVVVIPQMICSILDALICLHSIPIWHRDIKPSNIMVDNDWNVKLMDLGIATTDGLSLGTIEGRGFGTYIYAPPEQISGNRSQVNRKSDIYSLGVTLYELLTSVNPFAQSTGDVDMLNRKMNMILPYHELIPMPIFNVILKATERDQINRYQTALEFKRDLVAAIQMTQAPQTPQTPQKEPTSNDGWFWVLGIATTILIFTLFMLLIEIL